MADRSVIVRLGLDVSGYTSAADKASKSTKGIGDEAVKASKQQEAAQKAAGDQAKKLGLTIAGVATTVGVASYMAISAASDMNETLSKSKVVFGQSAGAVEKWGETAAKSMGMSKQAAIEAAATLGNLFVSMKIGAPQAEQMSTKMVQLAGDLASFNNANPADTLEALRAGLVGETEPLRKFGINLNDAALRQEALKLGLSDGKSVLDANAKAQASYALILEQSTTAQGDFVRTSGGLANQQRMLTAEFEDAKAKLGQGLLPVFTSVVKVANEGLSAFTALPTPVRNVTVAVVGLSVATLVLAPRIVATKAALIEMGPAGAKAATGLASAAKSAGLLAAAIFAAKESGDAFRTAVGATSKDGDKASQVLLKMADAGKITKDNLDALGGKAVDLQGALESVFSPAVVTRIGDVGQKLGSLNGLLPWGDTMADEANRAFTSIDNGLMQLTNNGHAAQAAQVFGMITDQARQQGIEVSRLNEVFPQYTSAVQSGVAPTSAAAAASTDLSTANKASAEAVKQATDAITAQISVLMAAANADLAALDAQDAWTASLKDAKSSLRDKEKAALTAAAAVGQAAAKDAEAAGASDGAAAGNAAMRAEFEKMRDQLSPKSPLYQYLTNLITKLDAAAVDRTMTFTTVYKSTGNPAVGMTASTYAQQVPKFTAKKASGGLLSGPGSGTSDSIALQASNGEYVVRAAAVKAVGVAALDSINYGRPVLGGSTGGSQVNVGGITVVAAPGQSPAQVADAVYSKLLVALRAR